MEFAETKLKGAFVIAPDRREDSRGFFARAFCRTEFEQHGLNATVVQCNLSFSERRGTVRGLHYQVAPRAECKLVRCVRGSIFDVIVDLRPSSPARLQWVAVNLSADNRSALFVPEGFAHGFQTLEDRSEVLYQVSEFYSPEHERGLRWNDPAFAINWPIAATIISERDQNHPDFLK
jgi:dTDP-4-dehydrorhamnose 3,5-epimerase